MWHLRHRTNLTSFIKNCQNLDRTFQFNLNLLDGCLEQLQANQKLGKETGATHAAAFLICPAIYWRFERMLGDMSR